MSSIYYERVGYEAIILELIIRQTAPPGIAACTIPILVSFLYAQGLFLSLLAILFNTHLSCPIRLPQYQTVRISRGLTLMPLDKSFHIVFFLLPSIYFCWKPRK